MDHQIAITLAITVASMALFAWNILPAAVVAIATALSLYFAGVLTMQETLSGFGDPVVILIAALLTIAVALETAGVGAWAGQFLLRRSGESETVLVISIMGVAAVFSGLIGMNGAVAAMLPVVVVVAVRSGMAPSKLMIPLAFACLKGASLTLLGSPVNLIAATEAADGRHGHIGFFAWSIIGIPQVLGTIAIVVLFGKHLLPERRSKAIPIDLSAHARTLVEQYRLEQGRALLRIGESSALAGGSRRSLDLTPPSGLSVIGFLQADGSAPVSRDRLAAGDLLLVRGDAAPVASFAADNDLTLVDPEQAAPVADLVFSRDSGLAEVVIPQRSKMIGQTVFEGMTTELGDVIVLAVQRAGADLRQREVVLQAGDHLLLQGSWQALDAGLAASHALPVDTPEAIRKQAVPLGQGAPAALAILALLIVLLVFDIVPAPIAATLCAALMIVTGVLTVPQAYRGIDWNTVVLIGAMIAPAVALTKTGAAHWVADQVVGALGGAGPRVVLAGLFVVAAAISQAISNTSTALVMIPIAVATAAEVHVSALPFIIAVASGASGSFLTPFSNGVSLMVYGPGGYRFGDFWRMGLPVLIWTLLVTAFVVPLYWRF